MIKEHCQQITYGIYSLSGRKDSVIVEHKVELDERIQLLWAHGLPDIRVVVYKGVPVMAALRMASETSNGKANLHAWGYYASIEMTTGKITNLYGEWGHVTSFSEYGDIRGVIIPDWDEVLRVAAKTQLAADIPLLGCDIVLDNHLWPILLEMNVRPWLEIQVVNKDGLGRRLRKVSDLRVTTAEKWVRLAKDMFWMHEETYARKPLLNFHEDIELTIHATWEMFRSPISPRLGSEISSIHEELVHEWAKAGSQVRITLKVAGRTIATLAEVVDYWKKSVSLGERIMKKFLIDLDDYDSIHHAQVGVNAHLRSSDREKVHEIDDRIQEIERLVSLSRLSRITNISGQRSAFIASKGALVPEFTYMSEWNEDKIHKAEELLESLKIPTIPLRGLFDRKRDELGIKIRMLRANMQWDDAWFWKYSQELYGSISSNDVREASRVDQENQDNFRTEVLDVALVKQRLGYFLGQYSLSLKMRENTSLVSRASVSNSYFNIHPERDFYSQEIRGIFAHEFETHALRRENGKRSWISLLEKWTAGYLRTEEGLALLNQTQFLKEWLIKRSLSAKLLLALDAGQQMEYRDWVQYLVDLYNGDLSRVFSCIVRLKRWMKNVESPHVYYKDGVYFSWYLEVVSYLWSGGVYEDLYFWKAHVDDIVEIKSYLATGTKYERILPHFSPLSPHSMNTL